MRIHIIGASHTGITLCKMLKGHDVALFDSVDKPEPSLPYSRMRAEDAVFGTRPDAYVLTFDEDNLNIKLSFEIRRVHGEEVPIFTILSQDSLSMRVSRCISNFHPINPAKLAAKEFVNAAVTDVEESPIKGKGRGHRKIFQRPDALTKLALTFISSLLVLSTTFFHFASGLSWVDSFYFTTTTMATVGYGDHSLGNQPDYVKVVGSLIMILSVIGVALVVGLVSDSFIRKRRELSRGKISYHGSGHVIVVGGGSVGSHVCAELIAIGEKPVILDRSIEGRYSDSVLAMGVPYITGDARDEENLKRCGLATCKSLVSVTQDDLTNLEVGLDARELRPDMRVVLRIYDQMLAKNLREMVGISYSLSMSSIAANKIHGMIFSEDLKEA